MVRCEGCGGEIDQGISECPYCGQSTRKSVISERITSQSVDRKYGIIQDDEGDHHIQFGDGQIGSRLPTGGSTSSQYRHGEGSTSGSAFVRLERKLDQLDRQVKTVTDISERDESKDVSVDLVETMATLSDILSLYQDEVTQEAQLSIEERDRLSTKEEKIKPRLRAMVAFSEHIDSKTRKRLGLSEAEVHKIKVSATQALQMMESGKCSRCGAINKQGAKHCQTCGAPL